MCTVHDLDIILRRICDEYKKIYGKSLVKVILYGSYARKDYQQDSDIDIVAIVRGDRATLQSQLMTIWDCSCELELLYDAIVSPTVIPLDEFTRYKETIPYYRNIEKEGVVISA